MHRARRTAAARRGQGLPHAVPVGWRQEAAPTAAPRWRLWSLARRPPRMTLLASWSASLPHWRSPAAAAPTGMPLHPAWPALPRWRGSQQLLQQLWSAALLPGGGTARAGEAHHDEVDVAVGTQQSVAPRALTWLHKAEDALPTVRLTRSELRWPVQSVMLAWTSRPASTPSDVIPMTCRAAEVLTPVSDVDCHLYFCQKLPGPTFGGASVCTSPSRRRRALLSATLRARRPAPSALRPMVVALCAAPSATCADRDAKCRIGRAEGGGTRATGSLATTAGGGVTPLRNNVRASAAMHFIVGTRSARESVEADECARAAFHSALRVDVKWQPVVVAVCGVAGGFLLLRRLPLAPP